MLTRTYVCLVLSSVDSYLDFSLSVHTSAEIFRQPVTATSPGSSWPLSPEKPPKLVSARRALCFCKSEACRKQIRSSCSRKSTVDERVCGDQADFAWACLLACCALGCHANAELVVHYHDVMECCPEEVAKIRGIWPTAMFVRDEG